MLKRTNRLADRPEERSGAGALPRTRDDAGAFDAFFGAEYPRLVVGLTRVVGVREEAEDLVQEAFVRAFERWPQVSAMESPVGYLFKTALHLHYRRERRRKLLPFVPRSHESRPTDDIELRADLRKALAMIPPAQREALVLTSYLGLSTDEAAAVIGIAPSSVRGRTHRARIALRNLGLEEGGVE